MLRRRILLAIGTWAATGLSALATVRSVPNPYPTIQSGIDAAVNGDTVLVAPGRYVENINYRGKRITVASHYLMDHNPATITTTIIDGSQPVHPDTGSVVLMISGEDTTTVLQGLTLTGGTGTPLVDQHNGLTYVEGGAILIENSSPVIRHNLIVGNQANRRPSGVRSAGGGGIRTGFGAPRILNNVIMRNDGRYGGGIVVNFAAATIKNNVICQNSGGQDYGGGGLWAYGSSTGTIVENNTIVGNQSSLTGGGIRVWDAPTDCPNNVVWGNRATQGAQQVSGSPALRYSCIQGGFAGEGNIGLHPLFSDTNLVLSTGSPGIGAGDPDPIYNDTDGTRNDMGAYGGPGASRLPPFSAAGITVSSNAVVFDGGGPGIDVERTVIVQNVGTGGLSIDSLRLGPTAREVVTIVDSPSGVAPFTQDTIRLVWRADNQLPLLDTLFIFHNDTAATRPLPIVLRGSLADAAADEAQDAIPSDLRLGPSWPNPFNATTRIQFALPTASNIELDVFDTLGQHVETLLRATLPAGEHAVTWDAQGMASGTYVCCLRVGQVMREQRLVLIR